MQNVHLRNIDTHFMYALFTNIGCLFSLFILHYVFTYARLVMRTFSLKQKGKKLNLKTFPLKLPTIFAIFIRTRLIKIDIFLKNRPAHNKNVLKHQGKIPKKLSVPSTTMLTMLPAKDFYVSVIVDEYEINESFDRSKRERCVLKAWGATHHFEGSPQG